MRHSQPGAADLSICTKTSPPLQTLPPPPSLCRTAATTKLPLPRRLHQAAKSACRHRCHQNDAVIATVALPPPSCHPHCRHRHPAVTLTPRPHCRSRHPAAAATPPLSCYCRVVHHCQHHCVVVALAVLALFIAALIPRSAVGCSVNASTSHHLPPICLLSSSLPPPPPPLSCSPAGCRVDASDSHPLSPLVCCRSPCRRLLLLFLGGGPR